jgi:hypothetical protein
MTVDELYEPGISRRALGLARKMLLTGFMSNLAN